MSKEYVVVFEKTRSGWSAYAPDLPGLGVAGETFAETERVIHDGLEFHIEALREDRLRIPEPEARVLTKAAAA